ncbi:MAG: hypothetical protein GEV05_07580 [Betaproteobacteria bacterium]|nr:hypothetical protein [Betaproteobacteria bacterium]
MTRLMSSCALALSLVVSAAALGQPFPNRPIRMVVPFEPGGSMDAVGRSLVEPWGTNLKQQIVIDNRGGAGGTVGTAIVAKATPDGHTILYANLGPLSIGPSLYRKLGYDLFRDLAPVSLVGISPIILFVSTALPVKSVKRSSPRSPHRSCARGSRLTTSSRSAAARRSSAAFFASSTRSGTR